ncbi:MAG: alkane 1-monooxygenase [Candidatus Wallbacteria bacterium]|nr:alkane 1-monooxygenase [Candidatus Wallbacteria bacterium]
MTGCSAWQALPYSLSFTIPLSVAIGQWLGGGFAYLAPGYVFGLLPVADWLVGAGSGAATRPSRAAPAPEFSALLRLHVLVQYALLASGCCLVASRAMTWMELVGQVLSMGIASGAIAINVAHELIHRSRRLDQFLGRLLLLSSAYTHFAVEHVRGHHRFVGTDRDPVSARLGESFWAFYPRAVTGSLRSAWALECERLRGLGLPASCWSNSMVQYGFATAGVACATLFAWGLPGLIFYLVSAFVGFSLLEVVNYVEHYGLRRSVDGTDRPESVGWQHSWNVDYRVGRWVLFELTRHSDHHMHASKPYEHLEFSELGPELPAGYPAMILLALVPWLWHRVMDPLASAVCPPAK